MKNSLCIVSCLKKKRQAQQLNIGALKKDLDGLFLFNITRINYTWISTAWINYNPDFV